MKLELPNSWTPRPYQEKVWDHFVHEEGTRAAVAWHRRAGKDDVALHLAACASQLRAGVYWHMLPEASQARKAIWDAVNPHTGIRRIDEAFPEAMRASTRDNDMFIRFINGSTWQVVGSDNFHSLVGSPPIGLVCSEWSRANPAAWAYLRPILRENGGWAFFISTYLGRNHHYDLVEDAKADPLWFGETLSAETTGVFTPEQLEIERRELVREYGEEEGEMLYRQEYLSDPSGSILGSFFGPQVADAEKEGRVANVPYERYSPVYTGWDLGTNDVTAIWFAQCVGVEPRIIDYYQNNNQDAAHYVRVLKEKKYTYGAHFLPHDGANRRVLSNSIIDEVEGLGLSNVYKTPRPIDENAKLAQINMARRLIIQSRFDAEKCKKGIDGLRSYRRKWDDKLKQYARQPLHDWASDPADAWRTLAVNWDTIRDDVQGGFNMDEWHDVAVA